MHTPTYRGEAMLLRWGDNSTSGRTVTFSIEDGPDCPKEHPFKGLPCGKDGQRFAIVVVPVGEDEHPDFSTDKPEPSKAPAERRRFAEMSRAQQAGLMCEREDFRKWFKAANNEEAAALVRLACRVTSRADLDKTPEARAAWDSVMASFDQATGRIAEQRGA